MKKYYPWILGIAFLFLAVGAFFIRPVDDDWFNGACPRFDFQWTDLLPLGSFWRPVEKGLGGFLGSYPLLFPALNHLLVVLFFVLTAWMATLILRRCAVGRGVRQAAFFILLLSPAGMATLFSVDAVNQAGAAFFGLLSVYAYLRHSGSRRYVYWLFCAVVAVFFKESGIAYFLVAPLFAYAVSDPRWRALGNAAETKKWLFPLLAGGAMAVAYLVARMLLSNGEAPFSGNPSSNYAMHLSVVNMLKNLGLLLGSALTTIDSIALFCPPRNWPVVLLSFLCGLPLLVLVLRYLWRGVVRREHSPKYVFLIAIVFCVAHPTC